MSVFNIQNTLVMHTLKSLILLFLFFGSIQLFADTKVTVKFPGSAGYDIFAWTYDDLISYREIEIGKGKMDEKGEFTFTFKSSEVLPIRIQVAFFVLICMSNLINPTP